MAGRAPAGLAAAAALLLLGWANPAWAMGGLPFIPVPGSGPGWLKLGDSIEGQNSFEHSGSATSLSSDGMRVAIGSFRNKGGVDNPSDDRRGLVRVYEWAGSEWTQMGGDIVGAAKNDFLGWSVSLSADGARMAIGAPFSPFDANGNIDGMAERPGHVRVYEWSGSEWTQMGGDVEGENKADMFGGAVSLSSDGTRFAAGAKYNDIPNDDALGDNDGMSCSASCAVVPASCDDVAAMADGTMNGCLHTCSKAVIEAALPLYGLACDMADIYRHVSIGHVRVYEWSNSEWTQMGDDIDGEAEGDRSGEAVSLSSDGKRVAIGAIYAKIGPNLEPGTETGHTRVYEWSNSGWTQMGDDLNGEFYHSLGGHSVSLSYDGSRLATGAPFNMENGLAAGHARMYEWSGSEWTQMGDDIDAEKAEYRFGHSVSLSSDGSRVAIGAVKGRLLPYLPASGFVQVYEWSDGESEWKLMVTDEEDGTIEGENSGDDNGRVVSLSADGSRLAAAAPFHNGFSGTSFDVGHVRVFEWTPVDA